jgi:hypothetical protein
MSGLSIGGEVKGHPLSNWYTLLAVSNVQYH